MRGYVFTATSFVLIRISKVLCKQAQIELANDVKLLQFLREIILTLEALLISLSDAAGVSQTSHAEVLFSSLFEAFWVWTRA